MYNKAVIIFGVSEGYFHNNDNGDINVARLVEIIKKLATDIERDVYNVYLSGVITPVKVSYKTEWGCPIGGEDCFKFECVVNPEFVKDLHYWQVSVEGLANLIKQEFKQTTMTIEFSKVHLVYLKD